jgi:hypothetical protein
VAACTDGVENLKKFCEKCGENATANESGCFGPKLKKLKAKVLFPFNRDILRDLERTVNGLQAKVGFSLDVLGM